MDFVLATRHERDQQLGETLLKILGVLFKDRTTRGGMSVSLNSEAGLGVGVQSTSAHQAPVSGQESGPGKKGKSLRMRKQMKTYSLTTRQQELTPKARKAKARKVKGVKTSGSDGATPGLVPGAVGERSLLCYPHYYAQTGKCPASGQF